MSHDRTAGCEKCEQPHPRCYGHNAQGKPCGLHPLTGGRVCRKHGGAAPQAKEAAARRTEEAAAQVVLRRTLREAFGDNVPVVNTTEALIQVFSWKYAEVVALRAKVASLSEHDMVWGVTKEKSGIGPEAGTTEEAKPNIWWVMLRSAEDQFFKFGTDLRRAGVEEGRLRLAEQQGDLVASVVKAILDRLDLTPAQQTLVGTVVPEEFRRLTGPKEPA